MSNIGRLLGGGKKKPAAPVVVEAAARPRPAAQPLVDETATRPVAVVVPAEAHLPDEEKPTTETDMRARRPAVAKPIAAPVARIGIASPVGARVGGKEDEEPPALSSVEPAGPKPAPEAASPAPKKPDADVIAQVKAAVAEVVKPLQERVKTLEAGLAALKKQLYGDDEEEAVAPFKDEDGNVRPIVGLMYAEVMEVGDGIETLKGQLLGDDEGAALAPFVDGDGNVRPIVPLLYGETIEVGDKLEALGGENGERIPAMVSDNAKVTADLLVAIMVDGKLNVDNVVRVAVERGPQTVKALLGTFVENPGFVEEILARFEKVLVTKLQDAEAVKKDQKLAAVKAKIDARVQDVAKRSEYLLKKLDWQAVEAQAEEYRKETSDGGDE
ncbi:MAG: hypothetical protein AB1529_00230 [Candidatus Micrarchaeota archaeon]